MPSTAASRRASRSKNSHPSRKSVTARRGVRPRRMRSRPTVGPGDWGGWVRWLAERDHPRPLESLLPHKSGGPPLLWSLDGQSPPERTTSLVRDLHRFQTRRVSANGELVGALEDWLEDACSRESAATLALECLAWCHGLPWLSQVLPAAPWCELLDRLVEIAGESAGISAEELPLAQQLLCGELPLTLAYWFPELARCRALWTPASQQLSGGIVELLDGEGLPRAKDLPLVRPLLACWTRCCLLGAPSDRNALDAAGREQYAWLLRQALRLTRGDGGGVFSPSSESRGFDGLLSTACSIWPTILSAARLPANSFRTHSPRRPRKPRCRRLRCIPSGRRPPSCVGIGTEAVHNWR